MNRVAILGGFFTNLSGHPVQLCLPQLCIQNSRCEDISMCVKNDWRTHWFTHWFTHPVECSLKTGSCNGFGRRILDRSARWFIFKPENPNLGTFRIALG
jgi:hypothetical protein